MESGDKVWEHFAKLVKFKYLMLGQGQASGMDCTLHIDLLKS